MSVRYNGPSFYLRTNVRHADYSGVGKELCSSASTWSLQSAQAEVQLVDGAGVELVHGVGRQVGQVVADELG